MKSGLSDVASLFPGSSFINIESAPDEPSYSRNLVFVERAGAFCQHIEAYRRLADDVNRGRQKAQTQHISIALRRRNQKLKRVTAVLPQFSPFWFPSMCWVLALIHLVCLLLAPSSCSLTASCCKFTFLHNLPQR